MNRSSGTTHGTTRPLLALALGALVLAAGVALARRWLPEWQGNLPEKSFFVQHFRNLAHRADLRLATAEPSVSLTTREGGPGSPEKLDGYSPEFLAAFGAGIRVEVGQPSRRADVRSLRQLEMQLSPAGRLRSLSWVPRGTELFSPTVQGTPLPPAVRDSFLRLFLAPGESLGETGETSRDQKTPYHIRGSKPAEHLEVQGGGGSLVIFRRIGGTRSDEDQGNVVWEILRVLPVILGALSVPILFLVLLGKRRIGLVNGAILAGLCFLASAVATLRDPSLFRLVGVALPAAFQALWVFLIWSTGESVLRAVQPHFSTSLDSLRYGRLGPRGGRSLLYGLALGAALGGLSLMLKAGAAALPGVWSANPSVALPAFGAGNLFGSGASLAAAVTLTLALALRFLPPRWAPWAATLAGALAVAPLDLRPFPATLAANLVVAGLLVFTLRRFGLTALLTAAVVRYLLPEAALSGFLLDWLPGTFAVTVGVPAALLVLGLIGMQRAEQIDREGRRAAPAFIRRLEEERRLRYEMDLLARMQLGLLPAKLPEIAGWEIAVRSLLATEAGGDLYDFIEDEEGRLWIAAGDVAGHGYSCSIAQAMTVAALSSLIAANQTPAAVLQRVDRVLRRNAHRHFTTLALLRLDPRTGTGRLANAGHPYALLSAEGEVSEIPLAGLPLGQGPKRQYGDADVEIPSGAALVFCSDGLFEATDARGTSYGYERPREVLHGLAGRPAAEILEGLLADWRRYRGSAEQEDDTTVVVVKRL